MKTILSYCSKNICGYISGFADKSISHRSIILSSLAKGRSEISGLLISEDVMNTIECFSKLGVSIKYQNDKHIVESSGFYNFFTDKDVFYMGNSGTSCRLLSGILSGILGKTSIITGDDSLSKRPMARVIKPLSLMGADIQSSNNILPLKITGGELRGIDYTLEVPSAQVKSAILLAGLFAKGETRLIESSFTRDHTENMFKNLNVDINIQLKNNQKIITLNNNQKELPPSFYDIPNDFSSASFFIALALITENSKVVIKNLNLNPLRTGFLEVIKEMGANIEIQNYRLSQGEPVADLQVKTSNLKGIKVNSNIVPSMIDEFPILFILSCFVEGKMEFSNIEELRHKESDRIYSMVSNLKKLGVKLEEQSDALIIYGIAKEMEGGIKIETFLDHRIAMSFLILGSRCVKPLEVIGCESIATSFPNFFEVAKSLGLNLEIKQQEY